MAVPKISPRRTYYFTGSKRNLTPIFDSLGRLQEWACTNCEWRSGRLDNHSASEMVANLLAFQQHFCKEFKKAI